MATSGHNGNNETLTGNSSSMSLTFYDESYAEMPVTLASFPINVSIERYLNLSQFSSFQYVNATEINNDMPSGSIFLQNSFKVQSTNASIHIEFLPINSNTSYLLVLKLGYLPIMSSAKFDFTSFKIFCPSKSFSNEFMFISKKYSFNKEKNIHSLTFFLT